MDVDALQLDTTTTGGIRPQISVDRAVTSPELMYASLTDEGFQLPEVPFDKVDARYRRQIVVDPTGEAPGTIVVHLQERFLYLVQPGGDACATASASAATASAGRAAPTSSTARNGRYGRRPRR